MRNRTICAALIIGLAAAELATSAATADGSTWLREHVRQHRQTVLRHNLGTRATNLKAAPRIIGGGLAPRTAWPFQVALLDSSNPDNETAQFCGGSLISDRHVLTAAHCVQVTPPSALHILVGTQSLRYGGTRYEVASIRRHPNYRILTSDYDVAVVILKTPVANITPVELLTVTGEQNRAAPGDLAYVIGWGDIANGDREVFPVNLYQVPVPIQSRTTCNQPASYDGAVTPRMICAGYPQGGKDSCQGDSGGPLLVRDTGGRWRAQVGIVSWGEGCAQPNFYGVYSRVSVLRNWIMAVVNTTQSLAKMAMCESRDAQTNVFCIDQEIATVAAETEDYLARIRHEGTGAQGYLIVTAQRAWSRSLASLCAFDAAISGKLGHKTCVLREMRHRAATLAAHLSAVGNQ